MEATFGQLQQAYAPSVGVAVLFETEEVAIGGSDVGADQDGPSSLKNLVVGADADVGEIVLGVVLACVGNGLSQDVMHRTEGEMHIEEIGEEFADAAEGAVADEGEAEDKLAEPRLCDGEPEEELGRFVGGRGEGVFQGVVRVVELLVDEFTANAVLVRQIGNRLAGQGVEYELLTCVGR